jgi:hypothetical protein
LARAFGGHVRDQVALHIQHARYIGQQEKTGNAQCASNGAGGAVGVDVEGLAALVLADGGNYRDQVGLLERV